MNTNIITRITLCFILLLILPEFLHTQYMGGIGGGVASAGLSNVSLSITETNVYAPVKYELYQNYPNPFNPTTTIRYEIFETIRITLKVYTILGQEVVTLVNEMKSPGLYSVIWNGKNQSNHAVSNGVYLFRLTVNGFSEVRKAILIK